MVGSDERFRAVDDVRDCEEIFEDYTEDLRVREKEERKKKLATQEKAFLEWMDKNLKEPLTADSSWHDFKAKYRDEEMFRKTDYDLVKDLVRDRISKLRMERRKKEEQESRKKREQEDKLIDAFETFLRPQRLTQWSEFVEKNETHESYVALKEMCGEKVVRGV